MSTNIKIEIAGAVDPDIIHRFRNFAEDIYRALKDSCSVSIEEIDNAATSFTVRNITTKEIGSFTQTIKNKIKKHHFEGTASRVRL